MAGKVTANSRPLNAYLVRLTYEMLRLWRYLDLEVTICQT